MFTSVRENWLTSEDATPFLWEIQNVLKRTLSSAYVVLQLKSQSQWSIEKLLSIINFLSLSGPLEYITLLFFSLETVSNLYTDIETFGSSMSVSSVTLDK